MAFIPTPHCIKVAMDFVIQGKIVTVTFMVETASVPTPTDMTNAAGAPATWWTGTGSPLFSNQTGLNSTMAYDQTSATAPTQPYVPPSVVFGGVNQNPVTDNTAIVTSPRSINRGRSGRGREFWPGMPVGALADSFNFTLVAATAMLTAFNTLRTQLSTAAIPMVINSRYSGVDPITHKPIPRSAGFLQPISTVVVDVPIGTQRRRVKAL